MRTYRTSEVAKIAGIHPNTVRLYEAIGFISTPIRNDNGYRCFTERQLFELKLARLALKAEILHKGLRHQAVSIIKAVASGEDTEALEIALHYLEALRLVEDDANAAIEAVNRLIDTKSGLSVAIGIEADGGYRRQEAAKMLGITIDTLRNWELNGLLDVPRHENGYRYYTEKLIQRAMIIKSLRHGGYSLMAILRLLKALDKDKTIALGEVLDTPSEFEEIISVYDRLLSCLREAQADTCCIIEMIKNY